MGLKKPGSVLRFLGFMLLNVLFLGLVDGKTHYYDFVVKESNFTRLCETKSILTVNGSFPGPTITARKGDTVFVNVHNEGDYGFTIHWHGVKQPRNPWSDGPENITQCPIQPGKNFTYQVILSDEEGTLWWHAHSDWTRATVHGIFVILPAVGSSYPFPPPSGQQTIFIGSWFKGDIKAMTDQVAITGGNFNISNARTINGQPGDLYPCSNDSTFNFVVETGKTYLLRIVNGVMNEEQFFGIANHTLTVVGQDGAYIKPIQTNYIMITPGQTMDILVTANQPPNYYYMASIPFFDSFTAFDNTTTTAILRYNNSVRPSTISFPNLPLYSDENAAANFTNRVRSLNVTKYPINVPKNITQHLYITIAVGQIVCPGQTCGGPNGNRFAASLNNVSFDIPDIDILQAYYRGVNGIFDRNFPRIPPTFYNFTQENTTGVSVLTATGTKVKMLNYGDAVEIVFQGTSLGAPTNHPMHVHGFSFYVVGSGSGNYNNQTDPQSFNLIDPPLVNTAGVPKNGWLAIRFFADNPGVWFIHCHLERHSSWGMDTVLIVKNGKTRGTSMRPPPPNMPSCSAS